MKWGLRALEAGARCTGTARQRTTQVLEYVRSFHGPFVKRSFARMAVIAVNTRLVVPGRLDGIGWFTLETVQRMVAAHPEHAFHLLFDRNPPTQLFPYANAHLHWVLPPARRPFLVDLWMDWGVPLALKRMGADLFLSPDGFLSRRTNVPQVAIQHDLNFEHHPEWLPAAVARHYRQRFPLAAKSAVRLATVSEFSARDIAERYAVSMEDIDVVHNGAGAAYHEPLGIQREQEVKAIRERVSGGIPFFVFVGTQHPRKNVDGLIDAFVRYREQGGSWHLVLVGTPMWKRRGFDAEDAMDGIPEAHRTAVHRTGWLPQGELAAMMAAAGALVFIPWFEGFGIPLLEAFAAGTPAIHSNRTSLPEVAAGAGLEVDPDRPDEVVAAMHRMENEPGLRDSLVAKGKQRAEDFSWDRTAQLLWSCLTKAGKEVGLDLDTKKAEG